MCHLFKSLDVMNLTERSVVLPFRIGLIFMFIYVYIHVYIYIYTSARMYIYIYLHMCTRIIIEVCVCVYVYFYSHILDCALSFSLIKPYLTHGRFMGSSPGGWGKQLSESGSHGALFADPQDLLPDGQVTVGYGNYLQFRSLKWSLMFLCVFFLGWNWAWRWSFQSSLAKHAQVSTLAGCSGALASRLRHASCRPNGHTIRMTQMIVLSEEMRSVDVPWWHLIGWHLKNMSNYS